MARLVLTFHRAHGRRSPTKGTTNRPAAQQERRYHEPFRHEETAWGDESTLRRSRAAAAIIRLYLFYLPPPPLPHFPPRLSTVEDSTAARRSDPLDSAGRQPAGEETINQCARGVGPRGSGGWRRRRPRLSPESEAAAEEAETKTMEVFTNMPL